MKSSKCETVWSKLKKWFALNSSKSVFKIFFIILAILILISIIKLVILIVPNSTVNQFINKPNSTRFYDRNGVLLYVLPLDEGLRREFVPLKEIPKSVQQAFIEEEDKNFYVHGGVDYFSILRAFRQNKKAGRIVSGASTITMQLARIIWPRDSFNVGIKQKIKELILAKYLEIKFSKQKILELYLNNIPFGFQIEGVSSAARSFFCQELSSLGDDELKILAKIPRRPKDYAPPKKFEYPNICPHFVRYVINEYAKNGLKLPDKIELSINSELNDLASVQIQQKIADYRNARINNGSCFAIDNRTGEIIVYVGNGDFYNIHGGQIDGVQVKNQPGSSMKPFLYALSIESGFEPSTVLPDIPMDFGSSKVYVPLNFNNKYNGPVRMRVALASSLNVPAVYLLYHVSVNRYLEKLQELNFESLENQRENIGLSIALGSSEVTLQEMVRAFSVFTGDGTIPELTFAKRAKNAERSNQIFKKDTCRILCDILSDNSSRTLGFGNPKVFETSYPAIFKTGTSNQHQDIIALGSTTDYTVGCWLGNFEGQTVRRQTGSSIPAVVVRELLDELSRIKTPQKFLQPDDYEKKEICSLSGQKPTNNCPSVVKEFVRKKTDQDSKSQHECNFHFFDGTKVALHYPSEYQHWATSKNMHGTFENQNQNLELIYPKDGAVFVYDNSIPKGTQTIAIEAVGDLENTRLIYDGVEFPSSGNRLVWYVPLEKGIHRIKVVCKNQEDSAIIVVK